MRSAINTLGYSVVAHLGVPQLLHRARFRNQLTILMYHGVVRSQLKLQDWCFVDEVSFGSQMDYLKRHFEVIRLSEAIEWMRHGRIRRPLAVITFDDGYQNNYDVAFPILYESKLPATIFLTTGLVNTSDTVWFCRLTRALIETSKPQLEWDGRRFDLSAERLKVKAMAEIQARLKEFPHSQLLTQLKGIIWKLGDDPDCPIEVGSPFRMLSDKAIGELVSSGIIEFGAHGHTHAILSRLPPEDRLVEIRQSVTAVLELTGRPCKLFAYPNGQEQDYDVESIKALEAFGIRASVTAIPGPNDGTTPAMELRRYGIGAGISMAYFQLKVHHFIALVRRLIRRDQDPLFSQSGD